MVPRIPPHTLRALPTRRMTFETLHPAGPAASAADAAVWHVRVLGGFELDDGRHCLTRLRSRAAMALVARLAMAPARAHSREELAALLWPDADDETGRSRLRQTLSLLRDVLEPAGGPPVLQADRRVITPVRGALWCDAGALEQALRAGQRDLAQALYRGELLPGFYDEWVIDERERIQALLDRLGESAVRTLPAALAQITTGTATAKVPAARVVIPGPTRPRLPHYLTRFVGADPAGARLLSLVTQHRLVSVLGPGGCGKTRLAVEVARLATSASSVPARFEQAAFVSLVGATGESELLDRLLLALRLESAGQAVEQLLGVLQGRAWLLVLDNCEQLDDTASGLVAHLAERLPAVHWLITSRRPLGLDGEHSCALEGLPLPALDAPLAEVAMNPAVLLFVDRARAHRADFSVGAGNRGTLVALVRWLEGLPLAIELAASHSRTLAPAELLALLRSARDDSDDPAASLHFLARRGVRSGSDPRHASMLEVIAWSWRLLPAAAQRLLARISLLSAGATLHAGAALGASVGQRLNLARAQAELDELVAHSVVKVSAGQDGQMRYLPYEPVREYALSLQDDAARHAGRHAVLAWLGRWAESLPATPPLASVRDELPNLMQALSAAPADGAANAAVRLVLALQSSWGEIALPVGVLEALDRLLAAPDLDDALAVGGHALAASSYLEVGEPEAVRRHMLLAAARPCSDPAIAAMAQSRLARMHWRLDRDAVKVRALIQQALPLARSAERPSALAALMSLEAHLATVVDKDPARGSELAAQALALWRQSGNRHLMNAGRFNVAVNAMKAGRQAEVLHELQALADEGRILNDWDLAAGALDARGTALLELRRWPEAAQSLRDALAVAWDGMQIYAVVFALWNIAPALARLGLGELAARTMGAAEVQWRRRFGATDADDARDLRRVRRCARTLLGPLAAHKAWLAGAAMGLADTVHAVLAADIDAAAAGCGVSAKRPRTGR